MTEDFAMRMQNLAEMLPSRAKACRNEEQTKQSLIQPVIMALGYDIFNPAEVVMEYAADAPVLKARNGKPESVDYAICIDGRIALLIEAKTTGENLDHHGGQLARYFMATECRHAILTNGLEWRFYSDLDRDNVMDAEPYQIVSMNGLSDSDIAFLSGFAKSGFSEDDLRSRAEKAMYAAKINDCIKANIIDDMSDDIIRVILSNVYDGIKSAAVVARFRPMISEEFDKCVAEKYAIKSSLVRKRDEDSDLMASAEFAAWRDGDDEVDVSQEAMFQMPEGVSFPIEVHHSSKDGQVDARALYHGGNRITLLAGSKAVTEAKSYIAASVREMRKQLLDEEGIVLKDYTFDSVSTAGGIISGRTTDGGRFWKVADGRSILEYLGGETWKAASRLAPPEETSVEASNEPNALSHSEPTTVSQLNESSAGAESADVPSHAFPMKCSYKATKRASAQFDATSIIDTDGKTTLLAGSHVSATEAASLSPYVSAIRSRELVGFALDDGGCYVLDHDIALNSPSTAASFVCGSPVNGNLAWRTTDGVQLQNLI